MPGTREAFAAPAQPESLNLLHEALGRFWNEVESTRKQTVPASVRFGLTTAVSEVATNIIRYAQADTLNFTLSLKGEEIEARLEDRGVPFQGSTLREGPGASGAEAVVADLAEGGRGLLLARRSLHRLDYERSPDGVNCWRLVTHLMERS